MSATWFFHFFLLFFQSIRQPYTKIEKYESIKKRRIQPIVYDTLQHTVRMQRLYATVPLSSVVLPTNRQRWLAHTKLHHDTTLCFPHIWRVDIQLCHAMLCYGCVLIFLFAKLFGIHIVCARQCLCCCCCVFLRVGVGLENVYRIKLVKLC